MKRDVKVGVFVATIICGLAAIVLGSGMVGRDSVTTPALRIDSEEVVTASEEISIDIEETTPALEDTVVLADESVATDEIIDDTTDVFEELDVPDADVAIEELDAPVDTEEVVFDDADFSEDVFEVAETVVEVPELTEVAIEDTVSVDDADLLDVEDNTFELVYVVKDGENFYTISKTLYGTSKYFIDLVNANPGVDPKRIRAGNLLAVPDIEGAKLKTELLTNPTTIRDRSMPKVWLAEDTWHVVQKGETLGHISKKYYDNAIKWPHIVKANPGLTEKTLRENQKILVPALTEAWGRPNISIPDEVEQNVAGPKVYLEEDTTHLINYGDTLQKISKKHYGVSSKWPHIVKANPGLTPEHLEPGTRIFVPALTE